MKAIVTVILLAHSLTATATESISVIGTGTLSCGVWLENSKSPEARALYTQWVVGFLSAHNYYLSNKQASVPDLSTAGAWLDSYCRKNPLHMVISASAALVEASNGKPAAHQWSK